jgi:hypothetical protein
VRMPEPPVRVEADAPSGIRRMGSTRKADAGLV